MLSVQNDLTFQKYTAFIDCILCAMSFVVVVIFMDVSVVSRWIYAYYISFKPFFSCAKTPNNRDEFRPPKMLV